MTFSFFMIQQAEIRVPHIQKFDNNRTGYLCPSFDVEDTNGRLVRACNLPRHLRQNLTSAPPSIFRIPPEAATFWPRTFSRGICSPQGVAERESCQRNLTESWPLVLASFAIASIIMSSPTQEQREPLIIESMETGDWSPEDAYDNGKQAIGETLSYIKQFMLKAWSKTTRRMRATAGVLILV